MKLWNCDLDSNTLRPRQNDHHFAGGTLKRIFLNENVRNSFLAAAANFLGVCSHDRRKEDSYITLWWRHNGRDSVSNHQPHDCLLNRLFRRRWKETSKLRVTGLCAGNSPGTGEFPAQMASNVENVSIWWRHHELKKILCWSEIKLIIFGAAKHMDYEGHAFIVTLSRVSNNAESLSAHELILL